jgi:hypothetical protein
LLDLSGTWNTTGTPTAIKLNLTNTASNSGSLVMDLRVNNTSIFNIGANSNMYTLGWITSQGGAIQMYDGSQKGWSIGYRSGSQGVMEFYIQGKASPGTMISFGASSNSSVAIKRSGTTLQGRLADDSGFCAVQGKLTTDTAYSSGTITPTGYLVLYDANGTAYRVPCVAN